MERLDTPMKPGAWLKNLVRQQIFIPLAALLILIVFNLIADPSFFKITMGQNSNGDPVLSGYLITILNNASELVILAIGSSLVSTSLPPPKSFHKPISPKPVTSPWNCFVSITFSAVR